MEYSNYNFLTKRQKKLAFYFSFFLSIIGAMYMNSNFFQAKMKGTWIVHDSSIDYGFDSEPKNVIISSNQIGIDNITLHINYHSKSFMPLISRKNYKDDIIYSFNDKNDISNDYTIIYNRKHPDELILMMEKSKDINEDKCNLFTLVRKGTD